MLIATLERTVCLACRYANYFFKQDASVVLSNKPIKAISMYVNILTARVTFTARLRD